MPLISLSTDFGNHDYLVGAIKGQIHSHIPQATIADISHLLSTSQLLQSVYICKSAIQFFPKDSFHIVLVNFFFDNNQQFVCYNYEGKHIFMPNNSLANLFIEEETNMLLFDVPQHIKSQSFLAYTAYLFNDIISRFDVAKNKATTITVSPLEEIDNSFISLKNITLNILFVDRFENVVLNIKQDKFEEIRKGRKFRIIINRHESITHISTSYHQADIGKPVAIFNSAGYLEIGIHGGSLAGLFGLNAYQENKSFNAMKSYDNFFYNNIQVEFYGD